MFSITVFEFNVLKINICQLKLSKCWFMLYLLFMVYLWLKFLGIEDDIQASIYDQSNWFRLSDYSESSKKPILKAINIIDDDSIDLYLKGCLLWLAIIVTLCHGFKQYVIVSIIINSNY